MDFFGIHNHVDMGSNLRLRDTINKIDTLMLTANKLGYKGVAITDHEALSAHVKANKFYKKAKDDGVLAKDFKLCLGNEIYLIGDELKEKIENKEYVKYTHFVLLAKDKIGYDGLCELSSIANKNSYFSFGMERVPLFKSDLVRVMKKYKGHIIASTACLGGELATLCDKYLLTDNIEYKKSIHKFLNGLKTIFGEENVFIEIHPTHMENGKRVNQMLYKIAKAYNIKAITATDSHYLRPEHAKIHEVYLKASNGEREVSQFYATTYLHTKEEFIINLNEFSKEIVNELINNTMLIYDMVDEYIDLSAPPQIPQAKIEVDFSKKEVFKPYLDKYDNIMAFYNSTDKADLELIALCGEGFIDLKQELNEENLKRLDIELNITKEISNGLGNNLSEYFLSMYDLIKIAWEVSFVGPGRGSGVAWYINYLLGITQLNPIKNDLPYWRFLTAGRVEMPDIDVDVQSDLKPLVREKIREKYPDSFGIATFLTEKPNAAITTIARALGEEVVTVDEGKYISSLFPKKKCVTIKEAVDLYGKDNECTQFVNEIKKYGDMLDLVLSIEGLVCGKGVHPAAMVIMKEDYYKYFPIMKSKGGELVTQHDLHDTEYRGGLKYDLLVIKTLSEIRKCFDLLLEYNKIEWQGNLKETYNKYLHPDVLEYNNADMWNLMHNQQIISIFQYDGSIGSQALKKVKPYNFVEAMVANNLMRISVEEGEQPIDRYVRYKNDIDLWYKDMKDYGLNDEHIKILEPHLLHLSGVADTQEAAMKLSMDAKIGGFSITKAHKLRKSIAKSYAKDLLDEIKKEFYSSGNDKILLDYVWNTQFVPMFGYAFSMPHTAAYTTIAIQQANLCYRYNIAFWKTAVLTTNSLDYSSIAVALAGLKGFVLPPDINLAERGFKILEEEEKCLFGFNSIMKVGNDVIDLIIENRPYVSVNDFLDKIAYSVGTDKMVNIIKAGCLDNLDKNRRKIMINFISRIIPERKSLTTANIPFMVKNNLVDGSLNKEIELYNLRKKLLDKKNLYKATNKTQGYFKIKEEEISNDLLSNLSDYEFLDENYIGIHSKDFDKYYKNNISKLTDWLKSEQARKKFTSYERNQVWEKYCKGNTLRWEMNSINLYYNEHELEVIPLDKYFDIENFYNLSEEPIVTNQKINKNGIVTNKQYKLSVISGAVIDKNKDKKYIVLSTQYGPVTVRLGGKYNYYNKANPGDPSWFERGTLLVAVGYRLGENFISRTYKESIYKHSLMKIDNYNDKNIKLKMSKIED